MGQGSVRTNLDGGFFLERRKWCHPDDADQGANECLVIAAAPGQHTDARAAMQREPPQLEKIRIMRQKRASLAPRISEHLVVIPTQQSGLSCELDVQFLFAENVRHLLTEVLVDEELGAPLYG